MRWPAHESNAIECEACGTSPRLYSPLPESDPFSNAPSNGQLPSVLTSRPTANYPHTLCNVFFSNLLVTDPPISPPGWSSPSPSGHYLTWHC